MNVALVPVYPGRPQWVTLDDWRICVAVHDAWFLRTRSAFRRLMLAGDAEAQARYQRFLTRETDYYAACGLEPPQGTLRPVCVCGCGHRVPPSRGDKPRLYARPRCRDRVYYQRRKQAA